ncbi:uncharacterized protein K02A2.6-like [Tigriopus californicus]|uniref:uncharacterized protein K02A2.6-like n=1 Tax=Tigriopus californicus TaxID=6832 RepID=UPI0027DA6F72|nr:uncharacterized protein K02A2.6-like [Tigriopus californicus]
MDAAVENHVKACHECQINTKPNKLPLFHPNPQPPHPWHSLSLDFYGPLPDGSMILVVRHDLTRFLVATILSSATAEAKVDALEDIYHLMGFPQRHGTDGGPQVTPTYLPHSAGSSGLITS